MNQEKQDKLITPPGDHLEVRCPRLGHQVSFSYCRRENQGLPCYKMISCWQTYFPVESYLRQELDQEEWQKTFNSPPKPKILSLVELIEKAKEK
ncbi:hypothetical protein KFV02_07915 [Desulfohalobiaceae bacterium Ax17]|jgi:hypothetical protein|uniref:hypothetical protein n=1 Tax=Desulfovulcanus ferrireducens TaxID=2831190 RepID=UPI00207BBF09|nr:hypothetical protein [Desulfovulcanus ferrireducens]MBT8763856.1 hypothetical protein [Desulfovulcanus ferrireducens]